MRKLKVFIAVQVLLFGLTAAFAQSADDIIAKNIAARGGMAKLKSITTLRLTGGFEIGGMQAEFVQVEKRGGKLRRDVTVQGMTLVQAVDGQNAWQIVPFTGKKDPEAMTGDELAQIREEADIEGPLMDYKKKGHKVELAGKEKLDGVDVYHLKVTLSNGQVRDFFLDAGTFLENKITGKAKQNGTELNFESKLSDYKSVDGVMVPFSIEQLSDSPEVPGTRLSLSKVEFNVPVDDTLFKMPAPAAKPEPSPAKP